MNTRSRPPGHLYNDFNADSLSGVQGRVFAQANITSSISLRLFLLVVIIMGFLMVTSLYVRSTVRSIGSVMDTALAIAGGDLERDVPIHRRDEIGLLAGAFNSMTGQLRDLVDRLEHRVAERTEELTSEIAERRHAVDQNAADLSDATRTAYRGAVEDADVEYLIEEVPVAIEQAIDGLYRVAEIVRALKDFSHPGGDTKTPLDLNELVGNTIAVCRNEWKYVAELDTDLVEELPPVPVLSGPMEQALLILIVNAAQAIADTLDDAGSLGRITVATSVDQENATIAVTDTGGGVPDEIKEKIFEHFFTTKDVGKGSGQGLAIARSIVVEQHGGEIDFVSTLGEGTTFRIRIPLELAPVEADAAA